MSQLDFRRRQIANYEDGKLSILRYLYIAKKWEHSVMQSLGVDWCGGQSRVLFSHRFS
jgi:hypothetical protein